MAPSVLGSFGNPQGSSMVLEFPSTTSASMPLQEGLPSYQKMDRGTTGTRSDRTGSRACLPLKAFRGSKERLEFGSLGARPEQTEQVHPQNKVQNAHPQTNQATPAPQHLADGYRFEKCLLAHTSTPSVSKIPRIPGKRLNLPVVRPAFRTKYRTTSIYKDNKSGGIQVRGPGNRGPVLPRRLDDCSGLRGSKPFLHPEGNHLQQGNGVCYKLDKVVSSPFAKNDMARHDLEYHGNDREAFVGQCSPRQKKTFSSKDVQNDVKTSVAEAPRYPQLCGRGSPSWPTSSQTTVPGRKQNIPKCSTRQTDASVRVTLGVSSSVVPPRLYRTIMPMAAAEPITVCSFRCSGPRLGFPVIRGPPELGNMVRKGQAATHQREGTQSPPDFPTSSSKAQGKGYLLLSRQSGGGSLYKPSRVFPVTPPAKDRGEDLWQSREEKAESLGHLCARVDEHLGGRSLPPVSLVGRMGTAGGGVSFSHRQMGDTTNRSVRVPVEPPSTSVPYQDYDYNLGGPGCSSSAMEQLELHISVPSPNNDNSSQSDRPPAALQRSSPDDSTTMDSPGMVFDTSPCLPQPSLPRLELPQQPNRLGIREVLELTRVEFLRTALKHKYSHTTADDMLAALAESSARQYESCWKSFQLYLKESGTKTILESTFFDYLSHLFHVHRRSLATVSTHSAALIDPLAYGCDIEIPKRARELIRKGFFRQRPTPRPTFPKWSLHKVLFSLTEEFPVGPSPDQLLQKACFLLALASGLRVSQLKALTRFPHWTKFHSDGSALTLAPSPTFLAKNEREDHRLEPLTIPALQGQDCPKGLCPVYTLKEYMDATQGAPKEALFVRPSTLKPLSTSAIATVIRNVIFRAEPTVKPKAHDVRKIAATLAFLRTHSLERIRELGQWRSCISFIRRYLAHGVSDSDPVAMGVLPVLTPQRS